MELAEFHPPSVRRVASTGLVRTHMNKITIKALETIRDNYYWPPYNPYEQNNDQSARDNYYWPPYNPYEQNNYHQSAYGNQYGDQFGDQSHQAHRPGPSSSSRETCRLVTQIVCRAVSVGAGAGAGAVLGGPYGAAAVAAGGQALSEACVPVSRWVCGRRRRRSARLVSNINFLFQFLMFEL